MFKRILYLLALLSLISTGPSFAQQPARPEVESAESKELIRRAALSVSEYMNGFKDLTAEEDQKVEEYDSQGKLEEATADCFGPGYLSVTTGSNENG